MRVCLFLILFILFQQVEATPWEKPWNPTGPNRSQVLGQLFSLVEQSLEGKKLLEKARLLVKKQNKSLEAVIFIDHVSYTSNAIKRKFLHHHGELAVHYESERKVYLGRNLTWREITLDFVHELTHFVFRQEHNPYEVTLSKAHYVHSFIAGPGGEAQAFLQECLVAQELPGLTPHQECPSRTTTREKALKEIIKKFYRIGEHFAEVDAFQEILPQISREKAVFLSATQGLPYPVMALQDYEKTQGAICQNNEKILAHFQAVRAPASEGFSQKILKKLRKKQHNHCTHL